MLRTTCITVSLGFVGGGIATLMSVPLAWMLGSLFFVLMASLAGLRTGVDKRLHRTAIAMLGLFIGNRIHADELMGLAAWYPSVLAMLVYVALMLYGGYKIFSRAGLDRMNAMFCSYPGSMNSAVVLAERAGGDLRWIAISHSMRLVLVVSSAALLAAVLADDVVIGRAEVSTGWVDLAMLVLAPLFWLLGRRLRIPMAEFLGPMAAGAVMANIGLDYTLPGWLLMAAFLVLGASVGARFSGTPWSQVMSMGRFGLLFALFAISMAALMAFLVSFVTELSFVAVLLALIPGGVGEMAVIAMAVEVDPVYVVTHHVLRLLLLIFMTPLMVRMVMPIKQRQP